MGGGLRLRVAALSLVGVMALTALGGGCASASWLIGQEFVGKRHVKYVLKQAAVLSDSEGNREQLFHYFVRICDLDDAGNHANCADSLILSDVSLTP